MGTGFGGLDEFFSLDQGMQDLWIGHWFNRRNGAYDVDKKAEVKQTTEEAIAAERAWMEKRRAKNG
jgi:hypothetical protein